MAPATVLNVDDSDDDIVILQAACESAKVGFRLRSVDGAENALLYLQGGQPYGDRERFAFPNLLLLDLKMPGKTGFDLLEWIRSHGQPAVQRLPVVVFTSSMHEEDAARAFRVGADAYLVKPSDFSELRQMVKTMDALLTNNEIDLAELRSLRDAQVSGAE